MLSLSLGPVALPVAPLLWLVTLWASSWLAYRLAAAEASRAASDAILVAGILSVVVSRLGHLAVHADLYRAAPLAALDIRDGGWNAMAGIAGGGAWLAWRAWRGTTLRRPVAVAAAAGLLVWIAARWALGSGDATSLPSVTVSELGSGRQVELAQLADGRPLVVNLWASWCAPCRQEMPVLAAAQQRETAVRFLFVNQGEGEAPIRAYLSAQGLPLREVWLDPSSRLGPAVGSRGLPTTLFFDAGGRRVDAHFGVLNAPALESRLRALRAERH